MPSAEIAQKLGTFKNWALNLFELSKAHLRLLAKRHEISVLKLAPTLGRSRHVVVMVIRNEAGRLPFFLRYYRKLGFEHFVVIDNSSTDHLHALLLPEPDVSLFLARGSYGKSRYGNDWINGVLQKYCVDKWILYVDADEFLVYPHCDHSNIAALTDELIFRGQRALPGMMVDMYSDRPVAANRCEPGQDPLSVCPFFDGTGYQKSLDAMTKTLWIKGGVRARIFFQDNFWAGPALNKTSLVLWKRHFVFLKSAHQLWPFHLNNGQAETPGTITGALLHFKFLDDLKRKISEEAVRRQHTAEYDFYAGKARGVEEWSPLMEACSLRYESWRSLEESGLIQSAGWPGG
jgi:hypothetical protein